MNINIFEKIKRHVSDNYFLYILTLMFILIGFVIGIYVVKYMGNTYKTDIATYLINFIDEVNTINIDKGHLFFQSLRNNFIIMSLIYIMGFLIVGMPLILVLDLIKGFMMGFTTSIIIDSLGAKGMLFSILSLVPQNIIYIPCIMAVSVFSLNIALNKLKNKFNKSVNVKGYKSYFFNMAVITAIFLLVGALIEAYICPQLIKIIY